LSWQQGLQCREIHAQRYEIGYFEANIGKFDRDFPMLVGHNVIRDKIISSLKWDPCEGA
jgi:hypothetical protein